MNDNIELSKIKGKIKFVEHFADYTVEIVNSNPDMLIKLVEHQSINSGEWQIVEFFPDFSIKVVENFGDFKIKIIGND